MNCRHFDTFHAIWMKICGYTPQTGTEPTQTNLYVQFSSKQLKKLAASAQTIATQPCRAKYRTSEVAMPTLMKIWFFLTADFLTTRLAGAKLPPQDETRSRVNIAGTSSMTTKRWWDRSGPALKFGLHSRVYAEDGQALKLCLDSRACAEDGRRWQAQNQFGSYLFTCNWVDRRIWKRWHRMTYSIDICISRIWVHFSFVIQYCYDCIYDCLCWFQRSLIVFTVNVTLSM